MRRRAAFIVPLALLTACATAPPDDPKTTAPDGLNVSLVMAREALRGRGPLGVGDRFMLEGKVVVYATYNWDDAGLAWGKQTIEYRWYSGDKLVAKHEQIIPFTKPPFYAWSFIIPTAIGAGPARVELFWGARKLAERRFQIVDQTQDAQPPRQSTAIEPATTTADARAPG